LGGYNFHILTEKVVTNSRHMMLEFDMKILNVKQEFWL